MQLATVEKCRIVERMSLFCFTKKAAVMSAFCTALGRAKVFFFFFWYLADFFPGRDSLTIASGLTTSHCWSPGFDSAQGFCFNISILTHANQWEDVFVKPAHLIKLLFCLAINCVDNLCESSGRELMHWESAEWNSQKPSCKNWTGSDGTEPRIVHQLAKEQSATVASLISVALLRSHRAF